MKRSTKVQFLPCSRSLRRELHQLDHQPRRKFLYDLQKCLEREVPKPSMVKINGKMVRYTGP